MVTGLREDTFYRRKLIDTGEVCREIKSDRSHQYGAPVCVKHCMNVRDMYYLYFTD